VKQGIAQRVQGGVIRIAASRCNGTITLSVYNEGPSLPADWEKTSSGVGISNVRTRLRGLYGDKFEMRLENEGTGGVTASVSIPFIAAVPKE